MKLKNLLSLCLLAVLSFAFMDEAPAQKGLRNFEYQSMDVDTATNADTINFLYPRYADGLYDLSWHVSAGNLSGTTAGTAYLQYSNSLSGADWYTHDSWAFSAAGDTIFVQQYFPAIRARVRVITSGTQSSTINNYIKWVRRKE